MAQGCTLLFEQTILCIGPAALLLLPTPARLVRLPRSSRKPLPNRFRPMRAVCHLHILLRANADASQVACIVLIGVQCGLLICWTSNPVMRAVVSSAVLSFLAAIPIVFLSGFEDSRSVKPSFLLSNTSSYPSSSMHSRPQNGLYFIPYFTVFGGH